MTDNEIIKALEELLKLMLHEGELQRNSTISNTIDLINRKNAEIEMLFDETLSANEAYTDVFFRLSSAQAEVERLKHRKTELQIRNQELQHEKSEAIKEFAERLKEKAKLMQTTDYFDPCIVRAVRISVIDNLVKEMVGDSE